MANTPFIIPTRHPFVKAIVDGLAHHCDITHGQPLLLAISGGSDSVALLRAMAVIALRRKWQLPLIVGHVQHHLRDESEDEATFVKHLAASLDLPFCRADLDINPELGNIEDQARTQRYDALLTIAKKHNCQTIVTAHHGVDQLETLLMRLIRGSGLRGLGAMKWQRPIEPGMQLIRPMLKTDKQMVFDFLKQINQPWCEDHTNEDCTRLRARLRQTVIPELLSIRPDLPNQIMTTTGQLHAIDKLLSLQIDSALESCQCNKQVKNGTVQYQRSKLKSLNPTLLSMVLREALIQTGAKADRISAKQLGQFAMMLLDENGSTRHLVFGNQVQAQLTKDTLNITQAQPLPTIKDVDFENQ